MADKTFAIIPARILAAIATEIAPGYEDVSLAHVYTSGWPEEPAPPAPDVVAPVIGSITPTPGLMAGSTRAQQRRQAVSFEVTDIDPGIAMLMVTMKYALETDTTVVYDGTSFLGLFDNTDTSVEAITDGFRFTLLPSGGWRSEFSITVVSVDEAGNVGVL